MLLLLGMLLCIISLGASTPTMMALTFTSGIACLIWAYIREF